jgi:hypothetical protein
MATIFCLLGFLIFPSVVQTSGVYKQVYPEVDLGHNGVNHSSYCDPSLNPNGTCPLFIAFMISFGGAFKSNGGLPGVQIALEEINSDPQMLPGYTLHYTLKDSSVS